MNIKAGLIRVWVVLSVSWVVCAFLSLGILKDIQAYREYPKVAINSTTGQRMVLAENDWIPENPNDDAAFAKAYAEKLGNLDPAVIKLGEITAILGRQKIFETSNDNRNIIIEDIMTSIIPPILSIILL